MYKVSNEYLLQTKKPMQSFKMRGTINGVVIDDKNILSGTLSISRQCSKQNSVDIGSVYISELKATFRGVTTDWNNAEIYLEEGLRLASGQYEYVPLGYFNVNVASETAAGIEITAVDRMSKFDNTFGLTDVTGTPFQLLKMACEKCGVSIGITQAEAETLPNGSYEFALYPESDIETWRDFVSWVAQTCASFATINREGKLILVKYNQNIVDEIDNQHRIEGGSYSYFQTKYTGISIVDMETKYTKYYNVLPDNGLTYNLGSNPLLQYGSETGKQTIRKNVLNGMQDINYAPFSTSVLCSAHYDLGDVVRLTGGIANGKTSCIMNWEYNYKTGTKIEGYGNNPALASAKSKTDKNIAGLMSQMQADNDYSMHFYSYTNAYPYEVKTDENKKIIDVSFASLKNDYVIFQAEILLNVETDQEADTYDDARATVTYVVNNNELGEYHPKETWVDGKHILNLFYMLSVEGGVLNNWQVYLNMDGGTATIPEYQIRASVYGQALAASDEWDGTLNFDEVISAIPTGKTALADINDDLEFGYMVPFKEGIAEVVNPVELKGTGIVEFSGGLLSNFRIESKFDNVKYDENNVSYEDGKYIVTGTAPQPVTATLFESENIEGLELSSADLLNCMFQFSADGKTWKSYVDNAWIEGSSMTIGTVQSLTSEQWKLLVTDSLYVKIILTDPNSYIKSFVLNKTEVIE